MSVTRVLVIIAAGMLATACGPKAPEEEEWMIGVFSVGQDSGCTASDKKHQYHVNEDRTFVDLSVGVDGPTDWEQHYRWEPRGENTFAVLPAEGEESVGESREWIITRSGACGPYSAREIWPSGDAGSDRSLVRGAVCVLRGGGNCVDYSLYYCDGEPEPCEEE